MAAAKEKTQMNCSEMRIRVTEEDIRLGVRRSPSGCMIARAVQRATGLNCKMGCNLLFLKPGGPSFTVPGFVSARREAFDLGWQVKPFEFEIPSRFMSQDRENIAIGAVKAVTAEEEMALVP
jgi:hypothetical protein